MFKLITRSLWDFFTRQPYKPLHELRASPSTEADDAAEFDNLGAIKFSRAEFGELGDWFKTVESYYAPPTVVRGLNWLVVRLDGRAFHTLTRTLKCVKPYDEAFSRCMIETAQDVLSATRAAAVYVQSDEISLVFKAPKPRISNQPTDEACELENGRLLCDYLFKGRPNKLLTYYASLTSTLFNFKLQAAFPHHTAQPATFDCRLLELARFEDVRGYLKWRIMDAHRNGISGLYKQLRPDDFKVGHEAKRAYMQSHADLPGPPKHLLYGSMFSMTTVVRDNTESVHYVDNIAKFKSGPFTRREAVAIDLAKLFEE